MRVLAADRSKTITFDEFFTGESHSREIFEAVVRVLQDLGLLEPRITKSQIAFTHSRDFAWVWMPEKHLRRKAAPLVLSLAFRTRNPSPRWKQIVEPRPSSRSGSRWIPRGSDRLPPPTRTGTIHKWNSSINPSLNAWAAR